MKRFTKFWFSPDVETGGTPEPITSAEPSTVQEPQQEPNQTPEGKLMTQEQIDKLISRAFAKGAKSGKEEATKELQGEQAGTEETAEAIKQAETKLQAANEKLLAAEIKSIAVDLGITTSGTKAAIKLGDFTDCFDESGDICSEDVKEALEKLLTEYPEFAPKQPPKDYASGTGTAQVEKSKTRKLNQNRII